MEIGDTDGTVEVDQTANFWKRSVIEILCDLVHSAFLLYREGAAALAMAAMQTSLSVDRQLSIVICCDGVPHQSKIVIFVYEPDIDPCRARLTMVAIYASACDGIRRKASDDGIVLLFIACREESQKGIQMLHGLNTGDCGQNTGAINGVLQTLIVSQRHAEGGLIG